MPGTNEQRKRALRLNDRVTHYLRRQPLHERCVLREFPSHAPCARFIWHCAESGDELQPIAKNQSHNRGTDERVSRGKTDVVEGRAVKLNKRYATIIKQSSKSIHLDAMCWLAGMLLSSSGHNQRITNNDEGEPRFQVSFSCVVDIKRNKTV